MSMSNLLSYIIYTKYVYDDGDDAGIRPVTLLKN